MKDLIDRQTAIDALYEHEYSEYCPLDEVSTILNDLLPAQPEQQWIPCSERLPEKPNVYTVTDSKDRVVRFVFTGTDSSREYWKRCAKAWMPLPTPYREE